MVLELNCIILLLSKKAHMDNIPGIVIESIKQQNILSGESEKNICNKVKSLINTKSTFITKKDLMI